MSDSKRVRTFSSMSGWCFATFVGLCSVGAGLAPVHEAQALVRNPEDLLIVDCLLPGQIRKLGRVSTFMSARRPIRTTQSDCEIRGGEYVSYDRANYQTALNVWMTQAQTGDAEAQNYVGEIYAKGLGTEPDYTKAREWYEKAIAQGYKRSMINLGYLYEEGLGMEKDVAKALNLYRQASGASDDLVYASSVTLSEDAKAQIEQLQETVEQQQQQIESLKSELDGNRRSLQQSQSALEKSRQELAAKKAALGVTPDKDPGRVDERLAAREAELDQERAQLERDKQAFAEKVKSDQARLLQLRQQESTLAAQVKAKPNNSSVSAELAKIRTAASELALALDSATSKTAAMEQKLAANQTLLASERAKFAAERKRLETQLVASKQDRELLNLLERQLADKQREVNGQRSRIAQLETQLQSGNRLASTGGGNVAARTGLSVEMIDPPITLTRSNTMAAMAPGLGTATIVGKVKANSPVRSVLVNQTPISVQNGIFRANVPATTTGNRITIIAKNDKGESSKPLVFDLVAPQNAKPIGSTASAIRKMPSGVKLGRYHALVIGNNNYLSYPKLQSAVNDAQVIGKLLQTRYGYKTTVLNNANRFEILSALNQLRETLTPQDNLLVYYAGHGELDRKTNQGYWIPVDGQSNNPGSWISNRVVSDFLNTMSAKHVMVIADSCYSGAMTRASVPAVNVAATGQQWETMAKAMASSRSRTALTSGGLAPVPDSGSGGHSSFAKVLINTLTDNKQVLEAQRLYRDITTGLALASTSSSFTQAPEYAPIAFAGHEAGEFFFAPVKT